MGERWNRREFGTGLFAGGVLAAQAVPALAQSAIPRSRWQPEGLATLRRKAKELGVRALVVTDGKDVILSEGAVSEPSRIASVRKSLVSALYGMAAAEGRVRLDATLEEVGVEDYTKLTPAERRVTVRDLLKARSGVYLPTSAETPAMKAARPARGSHAPGSFWYYNNWDFNVLGEIYQRMTGEGLFVAIEHRLARPLGWQDYDPLQHGRWSYDKENPRSRDRASTRRASGRQPLRRSSAAATCFRAIGPASHRCLTTCPSSALRRRRSPTSPAPRRVRRRRIFAASAPRVR